MSILNFSNLQEVKVAETSEIVPCGGIQVAQAEELQYFQLMLYKNGAHAGTEKLQVQLYHDAALTKLYCSSAWYLLKSIPDLGAYWLGWLTFTFARQFMNPTATYWVALATSGYTRSGDAFYLSLVRDRHIGSVGVPTAAAMAHYGWRWV